MTCPDCLGTGCIGVDIHPHSGAAHVWDDEDCPTCGGKGYLRECLECGEPFDPPTPWHKLCADCLKALKAHQPTEEVA